MSERPKNSHFLSVAVPRPLDSVFSYQIPAELLERVSVGSCVRVPFGRATTHAFVVEMPKPASDLPVSLEFGRLKEILSIEDESLTLAPDVMELCRWAHQYYFSPLGEALNAAFPSSSLKVSGKKKKESLESVRERLSAAPSLSWSLNEEQKAAVETFDEAIQVLRESSRSGEKTPPEKPFVGLLQGVTGSGKTEVYIELAKRMIARGRGVILIVPEIALTQQMHERLERGVGTPVSLWHSAVPASQRRREYGELLRGARKFVVGARSAVFAPVQDLGLIVIDEEHESTFKQEDRLRYHARDLAIVRAKLARSFVVLGSATPSLETLERVREGKYLFARLSQRAASGSLPRIETVDLREEPMVEKIQAPLAKRTVQMIQETLDAGEQAMIFLNRRGFAAFLLCQDCGEVPHCPHCSISLSVHRRSRLMKCHFCGHQAPIPDFCPSCSNPSLEAMGAGTESLEEELPQLLPQARCARLDRDQITSASRLEKILTDFRQGRSNVMLGTQMLAKGHDFPNVTLVVVVLADTLFRWPDFRASERAFQLLQQVSGRAGRGNKPGRVLIQTYQPDHPVLSVIRGELPEAVFLEGERELRKDLGYPPFGRLARIRLESGDAGVCRFQAEKISARLSNFSVAPGFEVLGPSEAFIGKAKGKYRWDLLIKARSIQDLRGALQRARSAEIPANCFLSVDVDPYGT